MATTDSIHSLGTTVDGENLALSLAELLGAADSPVCVTLVQNNLSLVWDLSIGGHRTPISITLEQDNPTLSRYTDSVVPLTTMQAGDNVELYFIGAVSGYATPICETLTQDDVLLIWFGIGGHATPVCLIYNEFIGSSWAQGMDWAQEMDWYSEWLRLVLQTRYGGFNIQNFGGIANPVNIGGIDD